MKTQYFYILFVLFGSLGCTKAEPDAYKRDPILQDYQSQLAATSSQLEALEKQIISNNKEIKNAVPQSGQLGQLQKKDSDLHNKVDRFKQQIYFWKMRIETRAKEAQNEYLNAYQDKKEWPERSKVDAYFAEKRLRISKMSWDQKDRIQEYKKANQPAAASAESGSQKEE